MTFSPFLAPERDEQFKRGLPTASGGTAPYTIPGIGVGTPSAQALIANTDFYEPFIVETPIVVTVMAVEVTAIDAGDNLRIGTYRADRTFQPVGAPLADSGNIDTGTTGVKTYTPSTPLYLQRGRYLSIINSSGIPTLRIAQFYSQPYQNAVSIMGGSYVVQNRRVGRAYAAFPTPGTAWTTSDTASTSYYFVFYRITTP